MILLRIMIMGPDILILILFTSILGALAGTFTGLVPGIHVNTLASVMLISYPTLESLFSHIADTETIPVLISSCIMSASVVHSFVDFVPSVFVGAPDPDEALTVLPGHRLLMEGKGMSAVRAAAAGSAVGAATAILLAIPMQFLMINGLGDILDEFTFSVVLFTLIAIVFDNDKMRDVAWTIALITLSGAMGYICMNGNLPAEGLLGTGTLLFPLLTGLFGMPALLESAKVGKIPEQTDAESGVGPLPGIKGCITGCIAGWYPGVTATAGAALSSMITPEKDPARFISLVASIGTVTSIFSIVTLSVSGSGRSGTVLVIKDIIGNDLDGFCSEGFLLLLLSCAIATGIGYVITIAAGKAMAGMTGRIDPGKMNKTIIVFILALTVVMTGPVGLTVLFISTVIGFLPITAGVGRIPLAGCLMVPVLISFF